MGPVKQLSGQETIDLGPEGPPKDPTDTPVFFIDDEPCDWVDL